MTQPRLGAESFASALGLVVALPIGWLLAHLPARAGLWVGRRLGDLAWWVLPRRRGLACANLARAFRHERSPAELRRVARQSFQHLGMTLVEVSTLLFRPPGVMLGRMELAGRQHLDKAAAEGRGILLLSAHLGNWELLAPSHLLTDFELSIVLRPLDEPVADRLASRFRRRSGADLIDKRRGLRHILHALRDGRMVGLLLDQNASRAEGVFVPFFGTPASTSKSLAVISLRTGAPVVPVFIRRVATDRHRVECDPALPFPPDRDVTAYTAMFNEAIEAAVRRAPEQWLWMHERWRTRPRPEGA